MNQGQLFMRGQVLSLTLDSLRPNVNTTFISHQNSDNRTAVTLATYLGNQGYSCYVDTLDPAVDGNDSGLERYLRDVIGKCPRLVAIVSSTTSHSWWVPLEIGVALHREKYIATYLLPDADTLPSYLRLWPTLRNNAGALLWLRETESKSAPTVHTEWRGKSLAARQRFSRGQVL